MLPARPYLIRAMYEWLMDCGLTPYVLVDTLHPDVCVPKQYINEDAQIVLNIQTQAVAKLKMDNVAICFDARFTGVSHSLYVPMQSVKAIYAYEDPQKGIVFSEDVDRMLPPTPQVGPIQIPKGRPSLKVVSRTPDPDKTR